MAKALAIAQEVWGEGQGTNDYVALMEAATNIPMTSPEAIQSATASMCACLSD